MAVKTGFLESKAGKVLTALLPIFGILLCLVFFYREFMTAKVFGWDDDLYQFYPGANFFASSVADGVFPFWQPNMRCGMPFYSDVQMGLFYPLKWLLVPFVSGGELSQQAYQCYLVFQYSVAGLLFYLLMHRHGTERPAAATGALVYCFSGFTARHIIFFASIEVMVWLPLVLMGIHHYFQKKSLFRMLLISFAVLLTFLPGFPQVTVYVSYFAIAYWMVLGLLEKLEEGRGWKSVAIGLMRELAVAGLTFLLAIIMGAVAFFPAFENWKLSSRATYGYDQIADASMPFYYVVNMFFPNFTGEMKPVGEAVQYWGFNRDTIGFKQYNTAYWHYWDLSCYAGQIGIIALLYSLAFIRSLWKSPFRLVCTLGAVFALWFMLGRYGGLFKVLYEWLPGISAFRGPGRMSCVFNTAQAVLAAYFVSDLVRGVKLLRIRRFMLVVLGGYAVFLVSFLFFGKGWCDALGNEKVFNFSLYQIQVGMGFAGVLTAVAFLAGRESLKKFRGIIFSILFLSVFFDLYAAHGRFHKGNVKAADYFEDKGQLIAQMQAFQKQNGICRFAQVRNGHVNESVVLPRNIGFMHDIEVPEGYTLFNLSSITRIRRNMPEETVRDLLNVGIIAEQTSKGVGIRVRKVIMPRAVFYTDVAAFGSREELLAAVKAGAIDHLKRIAVLESDIADVQLSGVNGPSEKCEVRKINNNQWDISYRSQGSGIVFVSQSYYPGWKAKDRDGTEYPVIETFGGLTGIVVPESSSGDITLRFMPKIFVRGALVSVGAIVIMLFLVISPFFRVKRSPPSAR